VVSVVFNVLVITFTLIAGFSVSVEDKEAEITAEYNYHGITGIDWGSLSLLDLNDWDSFMGQLQGFSSLIFCYVSHQMVFPLINDLRDPNKRRIDKVFMRVHITEVICNIMVGMAGYLLLAEHISSRPINAMVLASIQTLPISIGKTLMVFSLFFSVPLNLFPARAVCF
jgi:amino acid permease